MSSISLPAFGRIVVLRSKWVRLTLALIQALNHFGAGFVEVDPACFIQIDIYGSAPFRRDIDTSLKAFVSPPIEHHEEVVIGE